ncbi:hypothetical protein cyc_09201 [Cyclospora cayetanensis]|uniref:Uncharacterized protein n=1 Tax=Cyclospora cayetanensis TaxID=88456 RepID=A0A1D3D9N6_9EIME|nr:hypothetical protein cyc_09201 [Cyclospora cayetanensis]
MCPATPTAAAAPAEGRDGAPQLQLSPEELEICTLYKWLDSLPLSRPKRNLHRDFADGGAFRPPEACAPYRDACMC